MTSPWIRGLPAAAYYDAAWYGRERTQLFAREWLYATHLAELPEPGAFLTTDIAGWPLVIVRGADDQVRAFHNVCRHRGAPIAVKPRGNVSSTGFTCRYHGWNYDERGALAHVPHEPARCQRDQLGLLPVQVATWRGLVFVNLDAQAKPFLTDRAALLADIDQSGYPLEEYRLASTFSRTGNFNWKVWVEGYQECYHCPTIHPIFNRDFQLNAYKVECRDRYALHSCERKTSTKRASASGAREGLWLWVHPNLGMPCYEPCWYTLTVNPLDAVRTRLDYTFHVHPTVTPETRAEFFAFVEKITDEDIQICEQVQRNLQAGAFDAAHLHPERENGVAMFHELVRGAAELRP